MKIKISLYLIFVLLSAHTAFADFYNNRNYLMGNRAALMGGAYTALSEVSQFTGVWNSLRKKG
ncbi:MAG: hypothetical protein OEV44_13500 [Spirochaetota bacterium]|nr:hypothetical protein [Spirochaetota bacterium]